jgi:hypothetical protein
MEIVIEVARLHSSFTAHDALAPAETVTVAAQGVSLKICDCLWC